MKRKILLILILGLLTGSNYFVARAATTAQPLSLILTWSASNYYPSNFEGRALPTPGTHVTLTLQGLRNGKVVDLSPYMITWFVDEEKMDFAQGLTEFTTKVGDTDSGNVFVRAEVTVDNETTPTETVGVPVVAPIVVIEAPYPNMQIVKNSTINLRATPYFFNTRTLDDYIFYWQVGDVKKNAGSTNVMSLTLTKSGSGSVVPVSSYVQERRNATNIIQTDLKLYVQ